MLGSRVALATLVTLALLVEALGLWAGGTTRAGAVLALALVALAATARVSLARAGVGTACAASFFIPLYGVGGHLRPGDLLVLLSLVLLLAAHGLKEWPRLAWWTWLLTAGIVLVAAVHQFFPTDPSYLAARSVLDSAGRPGIEPQTNLGVASRFLVSVVGIPLAFVLATAQDRRAPRWLALSFTAGASLSGLVAFGSALGLRKFTAPLGAAVVGDREAGLAGHPNFLGATGVLAIAVPLWMVASGDLRDRRLGLLLVLGIVAGTYESGSRGGVIGLLISSAACVVVIPAYRRWLPTVAAALATAAAVTFIAFPSLGGLVLSGTRLGGADTQAGSDSVRLSVAQQGFDDFIRSPIDGVGLQVAAEAHNVYLQTLAAGGVVLFGVFIVYTMASVYTSVRLHRTDDLSRPLTASLIGGIPFGALENTLTYRFIYVPVSLVVALSYLARVDRRAADGEAAHAEQDAERPTATALG